MVIRIKIPFFKKQEEHKPEEYKVKEKIKTPIISKLKLKVGELISKEEIGRGLVKMSPNCMKKLGVNDGDIIEIEGKRKTGAIVIRSSENEGLNLIRMDGITRRNCGSGIGEYVTVRKVEVKDAEKVVFAPVEKDVIVHFSKDSMKKFILSRPFMEGDILTPLTVQKGGKKSIFEEFFGSDFEDFFFPPTKFLVIETKPKGLVRVVDNTEVEILPQGKEIVITEEDLPYARIINVKTLPSLENMLEMKSLNEISKLAKNYYINRYEDKKQVIYFAGNWYFRKLKK